MKYRVLSSNKLLVISFMSLFLIFVPPVNATTQEEISVYNISNGTLPSSIVEETAKDPGQIAAVLNSVKDFIGSFFNPPQDKPKYYTQSERVNQGEIPAQLKPQGQNFFDNLQKFVAFNTGFYGNYLPPQMIADDKVLGVDLTTNPASSQKLDSIKDYEGAFETTHFPEGISPITGGGQTNSTTPSSTSSSPGNTSSASSQSDLETRMIELVNAERKKAGVTLLTYDPSLKPLADDIAKEIPNLSDAQFHAHINRQGEFLDKRADKLGITYRPLYENLAYAQTFEGTFRELMNSPAHVANMLRPDTTKIAISVYQEKNMVYVAQEFR